MDFSSTSGMHLGYPPVMPVPPGEPPPPDPTDSGPLREIANLAAAALAAETAGRDGEATRLRRRALDLAVKLSRPALVAALLAREGDAAMRRGDVQRAVGRFESALLALDPDGKRNLAQLLADTPKPIRGEARIETPDLNAPGLAASLAADERNPLLIAELLLRVGNAYLAQPQDEVAKARYHDALRCLEEPEHRAIPGADLLRAHALSALALVHRRAGELEKAEATLAEALALFDRTSTDPRDRRRALLVRAGIERARGRTNEARGTLLSAIDLYAHSDDPRGEGRALATLGDLEIAAGRWPDARSAFERAIEHASTARDGDTTAVAQVGLGRCLHREGRIEEAARALRGGLDLLDHHAARLRTEEGKVTFLEAAGAAYDELVEVLVALPGPGSAPEALRAAERARGRALLDLMGLRRRKRPTIPGAERAGGPRSMVLQSAPAIPSGGGAARVPAPERSVPALPRLVFHTLVDRTAIFAVGPDGTVTQHVSSIGRAGWEERIAALRAALGVTTGLRGVREFEAPPPDAGAGPDARAPAGEANRMLEVLYSELVAPVESVFPEGSPISIEPHQALWLLPFAALRRADGRWLADLWPFVCSPSLDVLEEIRREPLPPLASDRTALIVGNPALPPPGPESPIARLEPLPGAQEEAQAIVGMLDRERTTLLTGADATRLNVEAAMPHTGILHFATHGLARDDDPLGSFVVLAGGTEKDALLTARRVLELSLADTGEAAPTDSRTADSHAADSPAADFPAAGPLADGVNDLGRGLDDSMPDGFPEPEELTREKAPAPLPTVSTDLVVLSACQTGLGRVTGDGVIGLSRAFLAAGARSVTVSLWSVSDEATSLLMRALYQKYYLQNIDKASALQDAMRAVRETPGWEEPRFWAPFVLVGAER